MMTDRIRLALQKKGRLSEESVTILRQCGLKFRIKPNALLTHVDNFPIDLLFVRDDDIPTLVFDGLCSGGIVGDNVVLEAARAQPTKRYQKILGLGCCHCRLSLAIPEQMHFEGPKSLEGKRIATSYPYLLSEYLKKLCISAEILVLSGSIELAPRMGMADAICDLVSSGQTLEDNKLKEVDVALESQAVFIQKHDSIPLAHQQIFATLTRRIQAVQQAQERKYIVFHAPKSALDTIAKALPGAESPTILPLPGQHDKVAVHVLSSEAVFWSTLETIQDLGASSILVLPVEKMLE